MTTARFDDGFDPRSISGPAFISVVGSDDRNRITIERGARKRTVLITDKSGIRPADRSCRAISSQQVRCQIYSVEAHQTMIFAAGGEGDDRFRFAPDVVYRYSAIGGDEGDDRIIGGSRRNFLFGEEGDDYVRTPSGGGIAGGEVGSDRIVGSPFDDRVSGGTGRDVILAVGGADRVYGSAGARDRDERISCGGGRDYSFIDPVDDRPTACETRAVVHEQSPGKGERPRFQDRRR